MSSWADRQAEFVHAFPTEHLGRIGPMTIEDAAGPRTVGVGFERRGHWARAAARRTHERTFQRVCSLCDRLLAGRFGLPDPERIEPGNGTAVDPASAVAVRNGHAVVTWHRQGIQVSRYDGAGWSAPQPIAPQGFYPDVAVSNSGSTIVVFGGALGLQASLSATSTWSPLFTLDSATSTLYDVAAEAAGSATVVWSTGTQVKVRSQRRRRCANNATCPVPAGMYQGAAGERC